MLENKVSNLLADVKKLEENISELNETIDTMWHKNASGIYFCSVCPQSSKNRGHMREHIEKHIAGLLFSCNLCDKTVKTRHTLRDHMRRMHK